MGNRIAAENSSNNCHISQLPNEVLIEIFSYLDPADFSRSARVCKQWQQLIYDELYWRHRLLHHHGVWKFNHLSEILPTVQTREDESQIQEIFDPNDYTSSRFICWMRQNKFCPMPSNVRRPIRLLLFGLGIANNKISRFILTGQNSLFEALSLIAGNNQGVGGGVEMKYKERHLIHVITLYTNVKTVRENPEDPFRKDLFAKWLTNGENDDPLEPPTLNTSIKELIRSVDCFVYTSYSNLIAKDSTWLANASQCLHMIMEEAALNENSQFRRPLLHLSCYSAVQNSTVENCSEGIDFIDRTQMKLFPRPWNICKMELNSLKNRRKNDCELEHGFNWLMYATLKQQNELITNY